ncbi:hypothetical protein LH29_09225 [Draconibacterium sediminis]|uniref:Uncharacterized protein n=1 Tax=Draconibacterium sediminis TaxID=1544798 RepID=A0A0D8JFK3_9BACT|nr:hypothetical protein LH29_09225 [Draconibacterium sediminis]
MDFFCSKLLITFCSVWVLTGSFLGKYDVCGADFDDIFENYVPKSGFSLGEAGKINEILVLFYSYVLLISSEKIRMNIPFKTILCISNNFFDWLR